MEQKYTPEELRAAADAFRRLGGGTPEPAPDPFGFQSTLDDSQALLIAATRGDQAEMDRIHAKWDRENPGWRDETDEADEDDELKEGPA